LAFPGVPGGEREQGEGDAMNAAAVRALIVTILTTLALAVLIAPSSAWAAGVVTTCDEAHFVTALSGGGAVTFSCGPATITVTSTKTISASTTIDGGGVITISGGNSVLVFTVNSAATFTVQNLTIQNGKGTSFAGGIANDGTTVVTNSTFSGNTGGAIYSDSGSTLTVTSSTFSGNSATFGGGAIYNAGTMTVTNSTFNGNTAAGAGADGGAIANRFMASITGSNISGNTTAAFGDGGGIYNASTMTITASVISGNAAPTGGGIYNDEALTISDSTISGNTATGGGDGAGLFQDGTVLTIARTTISGNTTTTGSGGGIYNNSIGTTITNATIYGNTAAEGGGLYDNDNGLALLNVTIASNTGGGITNFCCSLTLTNTIVANNDVNCAGTMAPTNGGTNLQFPGTTCGAGITSADPLLQALASNGGPTQTQALTAGSPAIDAGTTGCPPTPATDQRGVTRPQGPACDIGAFEFQASGSPLPPTAAKNFGAATIPLNGSTSLTFTINNPNASSQVSGVTLNDSLPAGLVVSTPNGLVDGCTSVTAAAGSNTIFLNDIILAANTSCTYSVNVTGTTLGVKNNVTDPITSDQGTGATASASVTVVAVGPPPPPPPPPPPTNTPIPTLQQWALWVLGLLLIFSAIVIFRRRKRD
jgi:predicted outer membrane repeat protein